MNTCPPYQGIALLSQNLDTCERTIHTWVQKGILPPPMRRGGKRIWKWETVVEHMDRATRGAGVADRATITHAADWLEQHGGADGP
jgi:DNA-binding transcriptional MerR regulator